MGKDANYWTSDESRKFHESKTYKMEIYHKFAKFIECYKPKTLLDYGCGNGYINTLLDREIQKTLYDITFDSVKMDNFEEYNCKIVNSTEKLLKSHFDVVLLNFVLICVPDEKTYSDILSTIKYVKKENGKLIILDCHPCFMQYINSYFKTEIPKNFQYLSYGKPFIKHLNAIDSKTGEKIVCSFFDFHWPLSFTINKLAENDFKIVRMEEWPDIGFEKYNETKNELYPPNYCLVCE